MWYVLWTKAGDEKKTRSMVNNFVDHSLFTRCIVPYRRKREIHNGVSMFVEKLLFPSYIFVESNNINDFAKRLQCYPGKNVILRTGNYFCPIYDFLTDMIGENDIIDSSNGYMDGDLVKVISGPLQGYEDRIKKVIWRKSLAILEMTLYERKVETALGLDRIANPVWENNAESIVSPIAG